MTLTTVLLIAAAAWWWRHRRPRAGAGASAEARARALRTPLVLLADALGIRTRAGTLAANSKAGAAGERRTARRVAPLAREGWKIFHDLAIPGRRENVDHLLISPVGAVFLPDSKRWSARFPLKVRGGRLFHGDRDVTARLDGLHRETAAVSRILGVPVTPLVVMDGAPLLGPHGRPATKLEFRGLRIIPADHLTAHLRGQARIPGQRRAADLAAAVERDLPAYTRHHRHP
ncbi:nuclease-related domain-containing protein [Streptomyces sp. NPDC056161]|uniref:nuclease-related domain-containing protein n=1 Tax=Streptomyces sp. NPDC056161 TaxID=3345732 RepID=UPI0035D9E684